MLEKAFETAEAVLYRKASSGNIETFIATTPETRDICNNPGTAGVKYTDNLEKACAAILKASDIKTDENSSVVVNILRGGLNYGLRKALSDAFGWNTHTTCFISAQRARNSSDSEEWHITENAYKKIYFPMNASLFIGDVVATGTSLKYALNEMILSAKEAGTSIRDIVFFTIGGSNAEAILNDVDAECRRAFPEYRRTVLIFIEGCFGVPTPESTLTIRLTGTDLTRHDAEMAPEFIDSQYENPAYPIERCTIYDAGSRAFYVRDYAIDVRHYWMQVLDLASHGMTYEAYLAERFPQIDAKRFGSVSLKELATQRISMMNRLLGQ